MDRCSCQRGCAGPVLRAIQRFGKLGKRSWGGTPTPDVTDRTNHNMKDMRYMYLSFDEAGTHVGCKSFRLVAAVYDENRETLLGTACSPPVRVLANNDVPTGAAHLQLMMALPATWSGWATAPDPVEPSFAARFAAIMDTPSPAKAQRRKVRQADSESDEPVTSNDDPESIDAATTPMHRQPVNPSSPYLTRRRTAAREIPPAPSPLCVSSGNSPSSLLMEDIVAKAASAMEIVSPSPRLQTEGSLAMWLEEEAKAVQQSQQALRQPSYIITNPQSTYKRPRITSEDASGPLPHSADFEPHFPVLLGPPSSAHQHHQLMQQHHQLQQHHLRAMDIGGLSSHSAGSHQGSGAMGQHHHHHQSSTHHIQHNHSHNHNHAQPIDDPIAAFVELMMLQTQNSHPPIVELPSISQEDNPGSHGMNANAMYQSEKLISMGPGGCIRPPSPLLPLNLPGEPTTSIATPTPSALEDLFAGIHATFDTMAEVGVNDDASFPPSKASLNPSPYVVNLNVDATVR